MSKAKHFMSYETLVTLADHAGIGTIAIVMDIGSGRFREVVMPEPRPHDLATARRVVYGLLLVEKWSVLKGEIDFDHPGIDWTGVDKRYDFPRAFPEGAIVMTRHAEDDPALNGLRA